MNEYMLFLFTKEEIELINTFCGEWAEFVWNQDLDVVFRVLECAKENMYTERG